MHEAILKDVLLNYAHSLGLCCKRHKLRLHIGREAGIFFGRDVRRAEPVGTHSHRVLSNNIHAGAGLCQHSDQSAQVIWVAVAYYQIAAGNGSGN